MKDNYQSSGSANNGNSGKKSNASSRRGKRETNLRKGGFLRFQIGLILALLLVYIGLEASFSMNKEKELPPEPYIPEEVIFDPDVILARPEKPKIIAKQKPSPRIKAVPNHVDVVPPEDFIAIPPDEPSNLDPGEIDYVEPEVPEEIPIEVVEEVPIFPGCEEVPKSERKACFEKQIRKHVRKNFRYPERARVLGQQGRVSVVFKIDKEGQVGDIQLRGPSELLEKEAERIISKLPKMTPGKQQGVPVRVPFSIPINFVLED
ncbi:energy transducer TonB [Poritiphilus flavus]|uniref:TonB family protein n=1 Tax=Poritiphilus flavus TaxID=2697053 RepID=A0A6L9EGA8_9FLAO|nr:energy transducer TonB [Poritiphilus flavus]NAS13784.1 TonB family protein [Poritiphilus flavus]